MRKIDEEMKKAVEARRSWSIDNTSVEVNGNTLFVVLHGSKIYMSVEGVGSCFTLAGYNTNVTRARLNALGVKITNVKGKPTYKGVEFDKNEWVNV